MPSSQPQTLETPVAPDIAAVYALLQSHLVSVEASLQAIITPQTETLAKSISHTLDAGGKMLRPVLLILLSGATGVIDSRHIETAAVAELIHVATLLHDDVLDDAATRRGLPTVKHLWGNKIAILSGDYLLAQASYKLSQLNDCRLVSIYAKVLGDLCEGEVLQLQAAYQLDPSWALYRQKSICKTAALFSACCESAGVLNACTDEQIEALKAFGIAFGLAFQMMDDLLDYTSTQQALGKPVFEDIRQGLVNAPILVALESYPADSEDYADLKRILLALFELDAEATDRKALETALYQHLEVTQAIAKTKALAEASLQEAMAFLGELPDSQYKAALYTLSEYALARNK